jgi:hypothetical protein
VTQSPYLEEYPMKRITIERYKNADELNSAGLIEGETDSGKRWIIYLDADGSPQIFWPERDEDGGVTGPGVSMVRSIDRARRIVQGVCSRMGDNDELIQPALEDIRMTVEDEVNVGGPFLAEVKLGDREFRFRASYEWKVTPLDDEWWPNK